MIQKFPVFQIQKGGKRSDTYLGKDVYFEVEPYKLDMDSSTGIILIKAQRRFYYLTDETLGDIPGNETYIDNIPEPLQNKCLYPNDDIDRDAVLGNMVNPQTRKLVPEGTPGAVDEFITYVSMDATRPTIQLVDYEFSEYIKGITQ